MQPTIITITGPSTSGKSTLAKSLRSHADIPEVKSFTTRLPRPGEATSGCEAVYDFVDRNWVKLLDDTDVIERVEFNDNVYGNTRQQLQSSLDLGDNVVCVVVEPMGVEHWAEFCRENGYRHVSVFLDVSRRTLVKRFNDRILQASDDRLDYELTRFGAMLKSEVHWGDQRKYTMRLPNDDGEDHQNAMRIISSYVNHLRLPEAIAA